MWSTFVALELSTLSEGKRPGRGVVGVSSSSGRSLVVSVSLNTRVDIAAIVNGVGLREVKAEKVRLHATRIVRIR